MVDGALPHVRCLYQSSAQTIEGDIKNVCSTERRHHKYLAFSTTKESLKLTRDEGMDSYCIGCFVIALQRVIGSFPVAWSALPIVENTFTV